MVSPVNFSGYFEVWLPRVLDAQFVTLRLNTVKVMSVVGARPQFVKLAPISRAFKEKGIEHVIVHTGQHYDPLMSDSFFSELSIPRPDVHLSVGSGPHGQQTGQMLIELEKVIQEIKPSWVLVYGDTNSTLAAALAAAKLQVPIAHLEAGLRSFNRAMPEEHNRVLTDHSADLLLAPTDVAMKHLADEGLSSRSVLVGDVMTDVLFHVRDQVKNQALPLPAMADQPYYIATIHRPQNTDTPERLTTLVHSLAAMDHPVFLLAHPRLQAKAKEWNLHQDVGALRWCDPLPYPQLVRAAMGAKSVITDSGGLQKEAFLLRTPCITVRTETEWVETVELGWNVLAAPGPGIQTAAKNLNPKPTQATPYGEGRAAMQVAEVLLENEGNYQS